MADAALKQRVSNLELQVSNVTTKVDLFIQEMRDRDNQRAADIRAMAERHDAEMKSMQSKFDEKFDKFISLTQTLAIAAVGAVGAIAVTVIYSIVKS